MTTMEDSSTTELEMGGDGEAEACPVEILTMIRRWRNEKYAPELLPFDETTVQFCAEIVTYVTEGLDEESVAGGQDSGDPDFGLRTYELERIKYILRDYLRLRLKKLSQWPVHYMHAQNQHLLSSKERIWLHEFWDNKRKFLENRFLCALPETKRNLDSQVDDKLDMIRHPRLEKHIYARICGDLGKLTPSLSSSPDGSGTQQPLELIEGNTYLVQYSVIRDFLIQAEHDGKVELI
mmetsp:Transcript_9033/g.16521  ORF Transcript_9033/g.16521 Transcript_9033/m.16521 type:complete len:236 (+) Transcript_9033:58-765(+)